MNEHKLILPYFIKTHLASSVIDRKNQRYLMKPNIKVIRRRFYSMKSADETKQNSIQ